MNKRKAVFDTNIFNKLILLSPDGIDRLCSKFELLVTDVSMKELSRMKDGEEKGRILNLIKERFEIIDAGIFSFATYGEVIPEDSTTGFGRGRMLKWEDAKVVKEIGLEQSKALKGRAFNDAAIALATDKNTVLITDEKSFRNKLKRCGISTMSFDEFIQKKG